MARKVFLILVGLILVGCAGGPKAPDQHLQAGLDYAYRDARSTVQLAESLSVDETVSDTLTRARENLESTRTQQEGNPSPEQYRNYAEVQELAREDLLRAFQSKLQESNERLTQLGDRVQKLEDDQTDRVGTLESQLKTLKNRSEQQKKSLRKLKSRLGSSRQDVQKLSQKLDKTLQTVEDLKNRLSETEGKISNLRKENQRIASLVEERVKKADVREKNGQVFITFQERILFDQGEADLSESSRRRLDTVASLLKKFSDRPIRVYGHTDTTPVTESSPFNSNWDLSGQRAINVLKYLVYAQEVQKTRIGAVAFADRRPLPEDVKTDEGARDRRVEVVLMPRDYEAVQRKTKELRKQNEKLVEDFSEDVNDRNLRVEDGSVYVNLTDQLSFPSARAELNEESRTVLDQFGPVLEETDRPIRIQGHTDDLPVAEGEAFDSNWELSSARAISVVQYLIRNFDLENREIGAVAMGQFYPLVPNTSDDNRIRNRRVEILLLPNTIHSTSIDIIE